MKYLIILIENKEELLRGYNNILKALTDILKLDLESIKLNSELYIFAEMVRKCVDENTYK